jgi:hypothetical protein
MTDYKVPQLMSSLTPNQLITQIPKPTLDEVINLETTRIHYLIDHLEFAFLVSASNIDRKDFNVDIFTYHLEIPIFIAYSCKQSVYSNASTWRCSPCLKSFCDTY